MKAFFVVLLWTVNIVDAVLLVLIVLLQSGRGGGLSGMLGGGGAAESALGPRTGLPKITGWMAGIFLFTAVLIGILSRRESAVDETEVSSGIPGERPGVEAPVEPPSTAVSPATKAGSAKPPTAARPGGEGPSTAAPAGGEAPAAGGEPGKVATPTSAETGKAP